jgi:dUTP pyrophosphatase
MYVLYLYTANPELRALYARRCLTTDSGVDLYVPETTELHGTTFLSHKVHCRMTRGQVDVGYYLYPRSSMAKTAARLANSVGIIDAGYRGEIIAALDTIVDGYQIEKHQRITQICAPTLEPFELVLVDRLEELGITARGAGGFGSTGR